MSKRTRKHSRVTSFLVSVLIIILVVGIGFLIGYRYIFTQTERFYKYDAAVSSSLAAATATTVPDQTTSAATDQEGNLLPTAPTEVTTTVSPAETVTLVNRDTPNAIMVYVNMGDKTADIAEELARKGVIKNKSLFTILSKVNGFDGLYRSGTHFVTADMSYDEIMYMLSLNPETIRITFREGLTYEEMKVHLKKSGINFDEPKMDRLVNNPNEFLNYDFVTSIPVGDEREYPLQGYLFPDTYHFDMNTNEKTIVDRMLLNCENKLSDELYERAESIGMSMDEVIILASIIQMESAVPGEMYKVSRVFHNRLDDGERLQSCATVNYIRKGQGKEPTFIVSNADMEMDDPYNTYKHAELPPGPICSPGLEAIKAALYPDNDNQNLYYFCSRGDGTNYFSTTLEEHNAAVERYLVPQQDKLERGEIVHPEDFGLEQSQTLEEDLPPSSTLPTGVPPEE
ncbi:MAG: endolytic transglycosylase MltG [Fastidiosipilaceae bacterium]|jgi:UPF0755 protein